MQTFLPYPDFRRCSSCLDDRRLGKQRVEAMQIRNALLDPANRWRRHPAVRMWAGYEDALGLYMNACIEEWERRGFTNMMPRADVRRRAPMPPWLGDERLHRSHRASLLRKDPEHYARFGWDADPCLPYFWPPGPELAVAPRAQRPRP
jgi:hypothetical protein